MLFILITYKIRAERRLAVLLSPYKIKQNGRCTVDLLECKDCIDDARENYYNLGHYFARKNG